MDNNFDNPTYTGNNEGNQPNYASNGQPYQQPNYSNNGPTYQQPSYSSSQESNSNNTYYSQQPTSQFQGNYNGYQQPTPSNGMAIASLVLGIISIPISCCWGIGIIPGVIAIILGLFSKSKAIPPTNKLSGLALAGIICGIVGSVSSIFFFIMDVIYYNNPDFWFNIRY